MKIDLCKLFGVEEGEEFRIKGWDLGESFIYKIKDNTLWFREKNYTGYSETCMGINNIKEIKDIIKLPKKKQFTDDELCILKKIPNKYKWCSRDRNKVLYFHINKPSKIKGYSFWGNNGNCASIEVFNDLFPTIQWEDEEPVYIDDYVERGVE